jgi:hypothetical protein
MSDQWPTNNGKDEAPPPLYANDKAWTKERQEKAEKILDTLNEDTDAKREHTKETLRALRDLVDECTDAISQRARISDMWLPQRSVLLQMLLSIYFNVTKDKI